MDRVDESCSCWRIGTTVRSAEHDPFEREQTHAVEDGGTRRRDASRRVVRFIVAGSRRLLRLGLQEDGCSSSDLCAAGGVPAEGDKDPQRRAIPIAPVESGRTRWWCRDDEPTSERYRTESRRERGLKARTHPHVLCRAIPSFTTLNNAERQLPGNQSAVQCCLRHSFREHRQRFHGVPIRVVAVQRVHAKAIYSAPLQASGPLLCGHRRDDLRRLEGLHDRCCD
mmetsp:Transcript_46827/g.99425  ORF Transcript_46827/g.99425 Transcript_46827/m.99425 type:complete len:225 (-) Transcript_46827:697-1371(-)